MVRGLVWLCVGRKWGFERRLVKLCGKGEWFASNLTPNPFPRGKGNKNDFFLPFSVVRHEGRGTTKEQSGRNF